MRRRIGAQVILAVGLVTALTVGVMTALILREHRDDMTAHILQNADQLSETIKSSTRDYMLENQRESLQRQVELIGAQEGIETVRLFSREGRVALSSDRAEIGRLLDVRAEACTACHAAGQPLTRPPVSGRARIFRGGNGHRLLGIVNPIENQPACWSAACHAHGREQTVLGVLDVTLSLKQVDAQVARTRREMIGLAALAIVIGGSVLWWLNRRLVVRPVQVLVAATRRVAEGDLTTTVPVTAEHELGELGRAFNAMTGRLNEAQRLLTQADKLASVGRLAAGVAHEINNPLTGVLTYASFQMDRAADPELKSDLEVIVRETRRCREIVRGLLDFARQAPPRRQPVDLNEVVRKGVAVVMNQLALGRVDLRLDLEPGLPPVPADANQIEQVVVNLLINAADAINGEGGWIRVATRRATLPPSGHAPIRKAACPRGCDLIDPAVRRGGLPAIRVSRACRGVESMVHLDPVYGRFHHAAATPCEEGVLASYSCPRCREPLALPDRRCAACGAPAFAVRAADASPIEWCSRSGCHWARWEALDRRGPRPVVEIEVEDSGRGIPAEALAHLFEPFFTTKGTRGTGLGLAVTWGIVEGHDGTIAADSDAARGSRFTVRLPLEAAEGGAAAAA